MIWGKTREERYRARWWFAWRPVLLYDGRWVWLQHVWRDESPVWKAGACTTERWAYYAVSSTSACEVNCDD